MRLGLLVTVGLTGCASPVSGAHPDASVQGSPVMTSSNVCALVEGRFDVWRGLAPFDPTRPPACVGVEEKSEWLGFSEGLVHYRRYRHPSGHQVWLFDRDEKVILIEVFPEVATSLDDWLALLGPPDRSIPYGLPQLMQRPLAQGDEDLDELVWGARGLALLRAGATGGRHRLARARGFSPMSPDDYQRRFVRLPGIEYHDPP
jgi:hypothetical protein